jgi:hypothetical protein
VSTAAAAEGLAHGDRCLSSCRHHGTLHDAAAATCSMPAPARGGRPAHTSPTLPVARPFYP